jgi:hypothetical protein
MIMNGKRFRIVEIRKQPYDKFKMITLECGHIKNVDTSVLYQIGEFFDCYECKY